MASKSISNISIGVVANTGGFTKGLRNAEAQTKKFGGTVSKNSAHMKGFNAGITGTIGSLAKLGGAYLSVTTAVSAFSSAIQNTLSFQKGMSEVATLGIKDLDGLSDSVRNVTRLYGLDLQDAVKGAYDSISAGVSEMQTPKFLEDAAKAATAGVTDLSTAVDLGTSVLNAFGMEASEANVIFDQVFSAVKGGKTTFEELNQGIGDLASTFVSAGLGSDEMFASIAALTKAGIKTRTAITSLRQVVANVIKPTSQAAQAADDLGISFDVATLKTMGLPKFLQMVGTAADGNTSAISNLFGSVESFNAVMALSGSQVQSFNDILTDMRTNTGQASEAFDTMVENDPSFAINQLKAEVKDLSIELGTSLIPAATDTVSWLKQMTLGTRGLIGDMKSLVSAISEATGISSLLDTEIGQAAKKTAGLLLPGGMQRRFSEANLESIESQVGKENAALLSQQSGGLPPLLASPEFDPAKAAAGAGALDNILDDVLGKKEKKINVTSPEMLEAQEAINGMAKVSEALEPAEVFDVPNIKTAVDNIGSAFDMQSGITGEMEEQKRIEQAGTFASGKASTMAAGVGRVISGTAGGGVVGGVASAATTPIKQAAGKRAGGSNDDTVSVLKGILEAVKETAKNTRKTSGSEQMVLS